MSENITCGHSGHSMSVARSCVTRRLEELAMTFVEYAADGESTRLIREAAFAVESTLLELGGSRPNSLRMVSQWQDAGTPYTAEFLAWRAQL